MGYLGRNPAVGTQRMLDSLESQFNGTKTTFDLRYGGNPTYPTLSESLIVSLGGVLQEPGDAYYVSSDKIVFSEPPATGTECWILLYSQYGAAVSSTPALSLQSTGEPMGHENRVHSTISFDNASRTFSIAPNTGDGHASYVIWTKGTKRIITESKSVQIGTATGLYYIYFDAFGELQYRTTYFDWANDTPTAYVYWNAATSSAPFVADERHGIVLDWQTHEYLHRTRGAVIAEGFSISNYTTTGDGSLNSEAQFDVGNGTFFDEDLEVNITHSATPTVGTFTQVLTGNAEIPVFYLSGTTGLWVRDAATEYACKQSATTLQYNSLSGVTWSTTPATDNRYVVSWVVATNEINAPIIAILGQAQYSNIGEAEATRFGDLTLTNFPIVEFRPLWKVIFRTSSGYTNTPNAYIAGVLDLRQLSETGEAGTVVSDHGLLTGLADDDHAQYLHASVDRAGVTANITTTGNITAANLIATGQLQGPANFVIDPAAIGDDTGTVEIKGNLTVQGTTTTINSTTLTVDDKNIVLADGQSTLANIDTAGIDFGSTAVRLRYNYNGGTSSGLSIEGANVGIGRTNPLANLDVQGGAASVIRVGRASSYGDYGKLEFNEGRSYIYSEVETGTAWGDTFLTFGTQSNNVISEKVRITRGGNVGIGTTNPSNKLNVTTSQNASIIARFNDSTSATDSTAFIAIQTGYPTNQDNEGVVKIGARRNGNGNTPHLIFYTANDASTSSERMVITGGTGNVGIGTSDPDAKLHVYRSDETGYALTSDQRSEAEVRITNPSETSNTFSSLHFYNGAGTGGDISLNSIFTGTNYISDFTIKIRAGGGSNDWRERLRIEGSDGDVLPGEDATQDFGSPTKRWANIYSADLQLSNEGSANEVDGTWGAYTIQEGEEALYLINRRSGKKFKFILEEVK